MFYTRKLYTRILIHRDPLYFIIYIYIYINSTSIIESNNKKEFIAILDSQSSQYQIANEECAYKLKLIFNFVLYNSNVTFVIKEFIGVLII